MKIGTLGTSLALALGGLAQRVDIISPAPNTQVVAGTPFTATVRFQDSITSSDTLALFFGAKANDPQGFDLGQTKLSIIYSPVFSSSPPHGFTLDVDLTFPIDMINGLDRIYDLTCGEFYTLGAENTPLTFTSQVPLFVASPN